MENRQNQNVSSTDTTPTSTFNALTSNTQPTSTTAGSVTNDKAYKAKNSQAFSHMDNRQDVLGSSSPEIIRWLCNLSESELDMLIRLKSLILHRAKVIGHDELAKNFDLPTLRAIGLLLMEYLKGKVQDLSQVQGLTKLVAFPECCNLLKGNPGDDSSIEELKACIGIDERKRPTKRPGEEATKLKKQRL